MAGRTLLIASLLLVATTTAGVATRAAAATPDEAVEPAPGGGEEKEAPPNGIEPPAPVVLVPPEYPPEALHDRQTSRVTLQLTIEVTGEVSSVEVAESGGALFDAAATAAARQTRFTPARLDGAPIACQIHVAYDFQPPPTDGALAGTVLLPGPDDAPAVGAFVVIVREDDVWSLETDEGGRFHLPHLPADRYGVRVRLGKLPEAELDVQVVAGQTSEISIRLQPNEVAPSFEVTVRGASATRQLQQSAQAVRIVRTEEARRETADLGEVLARSEGVGVQRTGGLGSGTRFSLNGLTDDQVRFLLDGVPLELSGYPFGIANVPVNLVERVEIYRGVVPVRFGADALGGAVNLVSEQDVEGSRGSASYQLGSFGTHRITLGGRHVHEPSGLFLRVGGFLDRADNDYLIDVEAADERGRLSPAGVRRFHDAYSARGVNVETGLVNRPWAKRLLLRGFAADFDKELQHNLVMTVPYGEAQFARMTAGATLRYEHAPSDALSVEAVGGYSYTRTTFEDMAGCVYDWFGQCVFQRVRPGEIDARPRDQILWQHGGFARVNLGWRLNESHTVRLALAPTVVTRTGDDRSPSPPGSRDPMNAVQDLFTLVTGIEHELDLFGDRLENLFFVKDYLQHARSSEALPGGTALEHSRRSHRLGVGNALRLRLGRDLLAKASYEWALRLPRPDEAFGDGVLIGANPALQPETSHNVNLGLSAELSHERAGGLRAEVNGFVRRAEQLIVLLGNNDVFSYQNVYGARSMGVEAATGWTSPAKMFALDANGTWQDFRNTSTEGAFRDFVGDRIPNRPYLHANAAARLRLRDVARRRDELSVAWTLRYVHEFFRGWESVGLRQSKQIVPSQLLQSLALTWRVPAPVDLSFTAEAQNLTDAAAFDFFGAQRPGRAFYFKTTANL